MRVMSRRVVFTLIGMIVMIPLAQARQPGQQLLRSLETEAEYHALPRKATIAMACSKCKSVVVLKKKAIGTKPGRGTVEEALSVHACPGCGGKITTTVRAAGTRWIHTCNHCGDDSAYCCAAVPGEKTPGM